MNKEKERISIGEFLIEIDKSGEYPKIDILDKKNDSISTTEYLPEFGFVTITVEEYAERVNPIIERLFFRG